MNEENRKIRDRLRSELRDEEITPANHVWENIQRELKEDDKVIFFNWRMAAALAIFLLGGLSIQNFWNMEDGELAQNVQVNEPAKIKTMLEPNKGQSELSKNQIEDDLQIKENEPIALANPFNDGASQIVIREQSKGVKSDLAYGSRKYVNQNHASNVNDYSNLNKQPESIESQNGLANTNFVNQKENDKQAQKSTLAISLNPLKIKAAEMLVSISMPMLPAKEERLFFPEEVKPRGHWDWIASLSPAQNSYAINSLSTDGVSPLGYSLPNNLSKERTSFNLAVGASRILTKNLRVSGSLFVQNYNNALAYSLPTNQYKATFSANSLAAVEPITKENEFNNSGFNAGLKAMLFRNIWAFKASDIELGAGLNYTPKLGDQSQQTNLDAQLLYTSTIKKQQVQLGLVFLNDLNSNSQGLNPYFNFKKHSFGLKAGVLF